MFRVLTTIKLLFAPPCINRVKKKKSPEADRLLPSHVICTREILDPSQQGGVVGPWIRGPVDHCALSVFPPLIHAPSHSGQRSCHPVKGGGPQGLLPLLPCASEWLLSVSPDSHLILALAEQQVGQVQGIPFMGGHQALEQEMERGLEPESGGPGRSSCPG